MLDKGFGIFIKASKGRKKRSLMIINLTKKLFVRLKVFPFNLKRILLSYPYYDPARPTFPNEKAKNLKILLERMDFVRRILGSKPKSGL